MKRVSFSLLVPALILVLALSACQAANAPLTGSSATASSTMVPGDSTVPADNERVTELPPLVLQTAVPPTKTPAAAGAPSRQGRITIDPVRGGVSTSAVQITVKGSGFPADQQVQVSVVPAANAPGQPAQGFGVGAATASADGSFETSFVMPSDQPDIAQADPIKVIAVSADGTTGAEADFVNTDSQGSPATPALDYVNPVYGYRITIPPGWRARQPVDRVDELALYDPSDKSQPGSEPIIIRALASPEPSSGPAFKGIPLEQFARTAYPLEAALPGRAELKSLQPLQPASGVAAYQAAWHVGGQKPYDVVITYFDFDKTIDGHYYRAIEASYDPNARHDAEYSSVWNALSLVKLEASPAANAGQATVQQFMNAFITDDNAKAQSLLAPSLREQVAGGNASLPVLLGVQNVPSSFQTTDAAAFSYANNPYVAVKGTMTFGSGPTPVQFQLEPSGNAWLIDEIISLQ